MWALEENFFFEPTSQDDETRERTIDVGRQWIESRTRARDIMKVSECLLTPIQTRPVYLHMATPLLGSLIFGHEQFEKVKED